MQLRAGGTVKEKRKRVTIRTGQAKALVEAIFEMAGIGDKYKAQPHEAPLSPFCPRRPA